MDEVREAIFRRVAEPAEDDLNSEFDYQKWRESWRAAYGYYPNQAKTLREFNALPKRP